MVNFKSIVLAVALIAAPFAQASILLGRVVGVSDGDTITLLDADNTQFKIRLVGIDSPEKRQAFGQRSKEALSDLIYDKQVSVEHFKTDRYKRILGKIRVGQTDINLSMIRQGFAWHFKKYQNDQPLEDRLAYIRAEEEARATKRGLWQDKIPVPPWEFRHPTADSSK
jgi:endonuclease YncB( thermonuclease family)